MTDADDGFEELVRLALAAVEDAGPVPRPRGTFRYPQRMVWPREGTKRAAIVAGCLVELQSLGWFDPDGNPTGEGRRTSVRFVFYRLVARGVVPKSYSGRRTPDQDVSDALRDLRYGGIVPLDAIVDEGAGSENYSGRTIEDVLELLRVDPYPSWTAPEVWTESASLAGTIRPTTYRYRVRVESLGGQASVGQLADVAARIVENPPGRVFYLGDLDLSGGHIEASAVERVEAFARRSLDVRRLAVTAEQVDAFGLVVLQKYDRRTRRTYDAVETEALGQDRIEQLVADALAEHWRTVVADFADPEEADEHDEAERRAISDARQ